MAETFRDRVKKLAEHVGGPAELAKRSTLSRRTIGAYMSGETDPKRADLLKLASAGDVSLEWLAAGRGEMLDAAANAGARLRYYSDELRGEPRTAARAPSNSDQAITDVQEPTPRYVYLPLYEVRAAAGGASAVAEHLEHAVDVLAFKEDWIRRELRASPDDLRLIYVEGDSMEPDLRAGDIILIDHTDNRAAREGIYVIRMDDALLVKQLQRLPGGVVKVISRNPAYEPFTVAADKLQEHNGFAVIGRVVWACRRF